jgi:hypothetical protein
MNGKIHKVFLTIFGVFAIPFAIIFFTDCLVRINSRK